MYAIVTLYKLNIKLGYYALGQPNKFWAGDDDVVGVCCLDGGIRCKVPNPHPVSVHVCVSGVCVCLCIYPCVCPMCVCLCICPCVRPMCVCLCICLCVFPWRVCLSLYRSTRASLACLSVCLSVCLSLYLSVFVPCESVSVLVNRGPYVSTWRGYIAGEV